MNNCHKKSLFCLFLYNFVYFYRTFAHAYPNFSNTTELVQLLFWLRQSTGERRREGTLEQGDQM
jgi:hypothetical protein